MQVIDWSSVARVIALISTAAVQACTVNGKPLALPGSGPSASPGAEAANGAGAANGASAPSTGAMVYAGAAPGSRCAPQAWADPWPYLDRPADPWLAVVDGRPARTRLPEDSYGLLKENSTAVCDAAHDHCLRDCSWLVADPSDSGGRLAVTYHVDVNGTFMDEAPGRNSGPAPAGFIAYRTVPVTRTNLRVGALALANADGVWGGQDSSAHQTGYVRNFYDWRVGTVASIDWDSGVVWFQGHGDPYFLSATRLAVIRYTEAGGVEAIAGVEARAPAVAETIAPGRVAAVSDPWAQVGKDHQPRAVSDPHAMSNLLERCTGAVDHCLRPWVWFVDLGGEPVPARWTGKSFVRAADPDFAIEQAGLAYRTRPARESELKPGRRLLVYRDVRRGPPSQRDAHHWSSEWMFAEVDVVDPNFHTFTVKGSSTSYPVDNGRLLVLYWLAGEDAAAVE